MKIKGIRYTGPIFNNSGYARACRGNILALHQAGIPLNLNPISFEGANPELGEDGKILKSLVNNGSEYNVNFIHTTPEFWQKHRINGLINVGFTIWETTKLHPDWSNYINNNVDKVLVGCSWNKEVFKDSGITIPIGVVPHGINMKESDNVEPFNISGVDENDYMFYGIFQWTERKHPLALLKGYFQAFEGIKDSVLVLKTYRNDYSDKEKTAIRETIRRLKIIMPMSSYPKIIFLSNMLTEQEIVSLHKRGDCYVSFDRGEGFGLSPFQAGSEGNPIIVTGFGGSTEYAKEDNSYLIDYQLTPVFGMPWSSSPIISVSCVDGHKKIKDVCVGDLVFNKNGNIKKVINVGDRPMLLDEKMHSIIHYSMPTAVEVTNKHKLYVYRNDEIVLSEVSNITKDDYLMVPKPVLFSEEFSIDMMDYDNFNKFVEKDGRVVYSRDINNSFGIYSKINLSGDLFYLIGLYLAEGCVYSSNDCVSFSFHKDEIDTLAKRCKECLISVFDISLDHFYERTYEDRKGYELIVSNVLIGRFFKDNFRTGSHDKYIPYRWCLNSNDVYRKQILMGYWDGDGHIRKKGIRGGKNTQSPECVAETASKSLFLSLRDLLLSIDIVPSVRKVIRTDGRISYIFSVSDTNFDSLFGIIANRLEYTACKIKKDTHFFVRVKSNDVIKDYKDPVYSISVEPDSDENEDDGGSYVLNGISSSNSPWYRGDQNWAEPDIIDGGKKMLHVYNNREEAKQKGLKLQKYISDNFSWEVIANKIIKEIEEIK